MISQVYEDVISSLQITRLRGRITKVIGLLIECCDLNVQIGEVCLIIDNTNPSKKEISILGQVEVVGFKEGATILMALTPLEGLKPGMQVEATGSESLFNIDRTESALNSLKGRVLDGLGNPIDGKGSISSHSNQKCSLNQLPPNPLERKRIQDVMITGIRAIDGFRTLGKGQRMGIFAGSGVGKSVLMGMIARNCQADINVVALIGERGREVKEFIEKDLGEEGLKRSIIIVATSEQPATVRVKAAFLATTIAEYYRDLGKDVMLMMDSSTRIALAQREIGLASGEPPTTRGMPPSVFSMLPRLFERAGMSSKGSITGLYTVLVEGDDMDEPIADAVRSILDGHIVLSRELAHRNHFPAIHVLQSVSRCMSDVISEEQKQSINRLLRSMALYQESEDMIQLGAYTQGSNKELDLSIQLHPHIESFLIQQIDEKTSFDEIQNQLTELQKTLA